MLYNQLKLVVVCIGINRVLFLSFNHSLKQEGWIRTGGSSGDDTGRDRDGGGHASMHLHYPTHTIVD